MLLSHNRLLNVFSIVNIARFTKHILPISVVVKRTEHISAFSNRTVLRDPLRFSLYSALRKMSAHDVTPDSPHSIQKLTSPELWFGGDSDSEFTAVQIASKDLINEAVQGGPKWEGAHGSVSRILLLDQFPRTVYRGSIKAFDHDDLAAEITNYVLDSGLDAEISSHELSFVLMPLLHSESIDNQRRGYETVQKNPSLSEIVPFFKSHMDVVAQFGRFPHRNAILGRISTPEEIAWLASDSVPAWAKSQDPRKP